MAWGRFLTNEGQPADHWLALTKKWKHILTERPTTLTGDHRPDLPTDSPSAVEGVTPRRR